MVSFEIDLSSTDLNLSLSIASDALDTSSLKKISLFEYKRVDHQLQKLLSFSLKSLCFSSSHDYISPLIT